MRISTSTCSYHTTLRGAGAPLSCEDAIRALAQAGFRYIDMNLCAFARGTEALTQEDWQDWCHRQRETAEKVGVKLTQAHAHFFQLQPDNTPAPWDEELMRRSIEAAKILGTEWMVFHPYSCCDGDWYSLETSRRVNVELFRRYADQCGDSGVHIAIENMIEHQDRTRRYCTAPEELIELHDTLNDPIFGICWDFGHANLNKVDQCAALRRIGKRLHALHVNDNWGLKDDHQPPFFGTIDWFPIMKTLGEIGYTGNFTYEDFRFHDGLPGDAALRAPLLRFTYELAEYLAALSGLPIEKEG